MNCINIYVYPRIYTYTMHIHIYILSIHCVHVYTRIQRLHLIYSLKVGLSVSEHLGDGRTIQVKHRKEASLSKRPLKKKTRMPDMPEIQRVYYEIYEPVGTI